MKYKSGASNIYQAFLDSPKQCKGMLKWQVQIGIGHQVKMVSIQNSS